MTSVSFLQYSNEPFKLVVVKNVVCAAQGVRKNSGNSSSSEFSRQPSISAHSTVSSSYQFPYLTSFFEKLRYISLFGLQFNRGYDGSRVLPKLLLANVPASNTYCKFHIVVHRIRYLENVFIVDLKRIRGDIWEFKRIYSKIVANLALNE